MSETPSDHWLVRPGAIRGLWVGALVVLGLLVVLDLVVAHHPHFGLDGTFGFGAWYGFASCVVLVLVAKGVGRALKRPDSYYGD